MIYNEYFHIYFPLCFLALKYIFYKFYNVVLISTVSEVKVAESRPTLLRFQTVAHQAPLSMGFLQARLLSGLRFLLQVSTAQQSESAMHTALGSFTG